MQPSVKEYHPARQVAGHNDVVMLLSAKAHTAAKGTTMLSGNSHMSALIHQVLKTVCQCKAWSELYKHYHTETATAWASEALTYEPLAAGVYDTRYKKELAFCMYCRPCV